MIDLGQTFADYAMFLPAVSDNYAKFVVRSTASLAGRKLPNNIRPSDLNFCNSKSRLFYYPHMLYSAAFGVNDVADTMVSLRAINVRIFGDSGGFSLISGAVKESQGHFRRRALDWQERYCNIGLPLDVPTRSLENPQSGFTTYGACLAQTVDNLRFVEASRVSSALRILNVMQGLNHKQAEHWFHAVSGFPFEGLAIAGHTRLDLWFWCKKFLELLDAAAFDHVTHIHFLGTSEPGFAVLLTALKRALRKNTGRDIDITFDSSRGFRIAQAYKQISLGLAYDQDRWGFRSHKLPVAGGGADLSRPFPFESPLGRRATVGDFMPRADPYLPAFDTVGNQMLSNHEVFVELSTIAEANRIVDMRQGADSLVPWKLRKGIEAIEKLFTGTDSGAVLRDYRRYLQLFAGAPSDDPAER